MKPNAWIGIDPGKTGAAALVYADGHLVKDWPGDVVSASDLLLEWRMTFHVQLVALERVHAMPKQGVSSTFSLGQNFGQWEGIIAAFALPSIQPTPQEWQKGLVKPSDGPDAKSRALVVARRLFPDAELSRKKDNGRADALLMAWWARQTRP